MDLPLEGIRVVEAAAFVTGPMAAMILGDLGADVIKVEPPRGDPYRRVGHKRNGTGITFFNLNRNKRSVVLDLKSEEGRDSVLELVAGADVFVCNWRPGVAADLGLADAVLADLNPRLVRLWVSGFGPDGPLGRRPAFDWLLQAQTGLAHAQGAGGRPEMVRTIVADKTTALMGAQAVLAALVARGSDGPGRAIELAMLDVMSYVNFPDLMNAYTFLAEEGETLPARRPTRSPILATADGHIVVAPVSGAQIGAALDAIGRPEWKAELRATSTPEDLFDTMLDRIETVTRGGPTSEWLARFAAHDVPAAPVLDPDRHLADEQVVHNQLYREALHPTLGRHREVRYPAVFSGERRPSSRRPVPMLGEHTAHHPWE